MIADFDAGTIALFGSENRALVLCVLANAAAPLTAYRVAKTFGGQKIKVGAELRKLETAGIVSRSKLEGGQVAWRLRDPDLRSFLCRRIRVSFDVDWDGGKPGSGEAVNQLLDEIEARLPEPSSRPGFYRPRAWRPTPEARALLREMARSPEKDAILRKYAARTSRRAGKTR